MSSAHRQYRLVPYSHYQQSLTNTTTSAAAAADDDDDDDNGAVKHRRSHDSDVCEPSLKKPCHHDTSVSPS